MAVVFFLYRKTAIVFLRQDLCKDDPISIIDLATGRFLRIELPRHAEHSSVQLSFNAHPSLVIFREKTKQKVCSDVDGAEDGYHEFLEVISEATKHWLGKYVIGATNSGLKVRGHVRAILPLADLSGIGFRLLIEQNNFPCESFSIGPWQLLCPSRTTIEETDCPDNKPSILKSFWEAIRWFSPDYRRYKKDNPDA